MHAEILVRIELTLPVEHPDLAACVTDDSAFAVGKLLGFGDEHVRHEYAADYRTWEPQMRRFSRSHRCVTYSQRGYPPSDIPNDPDKYSQDCFNDDVIAVMDALRIDKAHIVGHSMGSLTALHVGIRHPQRCISMTAAGCGYGSSADRKAVEDTRAASRETGKMFASTDIKTAAARYADGPTRQAHKNKDPRGYAEFVQILSEHSAHAAPLFVCAFRLCDARRPRFTVARRGHRH